MAIKFKNYVLAGSNGNVKEVGLNVVFTATLLDNTVWNGEPFTITLTDDDSAFHKKTVTVETVDGSTEMITKTIPFSYSNMHIEVRGYCTRYLGEQKTLGNLINNVPNSTLEQYFTGQINTDGSGVFQITLKADTGYKFIKGSLKNDMNQTFDYYNDLTVAKQLIGNGLNNLDVGWVFTGQTVEKDTEVINNITGNVTERHTVNGSNVYITLTGNSEAAKFVGVYVEYVDVNGETKTVIPDYSGNVINISLTDVKHGANVVLSGDYRLVCNTVNSLTGCEVTGLKSFYIENETVNVVATAKSGTHFDSTNVPFAQWETISQGTTNHQFTLSEDGKTATLNFTFPNDKEKVSDSTFTLLGGTIPYKVVTGYGSVNVYLVDTKTLDEFSKIRFTKKINESYEYEYYDIGTYVNSLHKVYVNVKNVSKTSLKLANFDTGIETNSVDDSKVHLDFGDLVLPVYSNNSNDFNATVQCFIPFVGFVPVDSDFIGKTINLSYDIDLVTGYCGYNLMCDGITVNNGTANCCSEIIYKTLADNEVNTIGDSSYLNTVLMGLEPYVIIKYFEPLNFPVNNTVESKRIGDVTGFAQFENVNLDTVNLLVDEYNDIVSQLETGVYL